MVSSCKNITDDCPQSRAILGMSSYLPMRATASTRGDDIHQTTTENPAFMEHFLNIPEICPSSTDYRSPRYYMGSYQAEACRMEALQQHRNDLRMGIQGGRGAFYPNMSVPSNLRFRENCNDTISANGGNNKAEPLSPCSTGTPTASTDGDTPPSFYPWMSIVGQYSLIVLT